MKRLAKVLLGFNAMALIYLIQLKPRLFLEACQSAFTSSRHARLRGPWVHEITLGEILGDRKPSVRMAVMRYEDGMLPSEQLMALLAILVSESPSEVLEIGTFMGHTTLHLAENVEAATIHTVDLPEDFTDGQDQPELPPKDDFHLIARRRVGREFKAGPCASRIRQHFEDTATWDFRTAGNPTFFFIDGSHTYEYCKNDSEKCFELCNGRGVFLWHDCDDAHPGVVRLILEWRNKGRDVRRIAGTPIAYWKSN